MASIFSKKKKRRKHMKSWIEKWSYQALCKKTKIANYSFNKRNNLVSSIECSANLQNINLQWECLYDWETSLEFSCQNRIAAGFFRVFRLGAEVRWYCAQFCLTPYYPMPCGPQAPLCPWIFRQEFWMGCHFLVHPQVGWVHE